MILARRFTFIVEKKLKIHVISLKNGVTTSYLLRHIS